MPFLLLDDLRDSVGNELKQHADALLSAGQNAVQSISDATPQVQGPDPNDVLRQLQQHAQDLSDQAAQAAQPALQTLGGAPQAAGGAVQELGQSRDQVLQQLQDHAASLTQSQDSGVQVLPQPEAPAAPQVLDSGTPSTASTQAPAPDRSSSLQDYARAAAQRAGIDPDVFVRQIQQESGFSPTAKSPAGAIGIAQFMPATAAGLKLDPTDPYASLDAAAQMDAQNLSKYGGDWRKVLAAYNAGPGAVDQYGGVPPYAETQQYVKTILGDSNPIEQLKQGAQDLVQGAKQAVTSKLSDLSQFGDQQLSAAEAYAACGPAAAVRFAQLFGRNPTLREATDLAAKVGWTAASGMAGLGSEGALFDELQIPHRQVGADWNALAREASSGNPVVISTPGHYFTADGYDPNSGAFHVGRSGLDLKGGSEWMTPDQMQQRMGALQGGLAVDNPTVPGGSPLSQGTQTAAKQPLYAGLLQDASGQDVAGTQAPTPITAAADLLKRGAQTAQDLTQNVQDAVQGAAANPIVQDVGQNIVKPLLGMPNTSDTTLTPDTLKGATLQGFSSPTTLEDLKDQLGGLHDKLDDLRDNFQSPLTLEDVTQNPIVQDAARNIVAPMLGMPNTPIKGMGGGMGVLDSLDTLQELNDKYAGTPGSQTVPMKGQAPLTLSVDPSEMTPEDQQRYQQAQANVAGITMPAVDQPTLGAIRSGGLIPGPMPTGTRGPIATAVDVTKQFMLSNPSTHVGNTIGNTLELLRSPVALTLGGRPLDALAGMGATARALPEATTSALQALRGTAPASLGSAAQTSRWWQPVYKALGAADQFTRTLGEYQGMAEQASALLRQAGIDPASARAQPFLQSHAADLLDAGRRNGGNSVFQMQRTATGGLNFLDDLFNRFGRYKEGLLSSPSNLDQALGALLDTQIPFSGVPSRILQIGVGRLPGVAQVSGAARAVRAARAGDIPTMQREIGNTLMESAIQLWIAEQVRQGNIRGPDDPDHPGEVNLMGNWVNGGLLGAYALPAMIMAASAEGFGKALTKPTEGAGDALTQRLGNALTSATKPFVQAIPGMQMVHFLSSLGEGPGTALKGEVQDTINRITAPGAAKFIEDLTDPTQRDVSKGLAGLWETPMSRWPALAEMLPSRIDPTTGEPMEKRRSGLGTLIGAESWDESAIREEANRLSKLGYGTTPPSTYPDQVTVGRSIVTLKPDEQRQVAEITGKMLGNFAVRLETPAYQNANDATKARMMQAYLNAADRAKVSAALKVLGRPELMRRVALGQKDIGGRLANQGPSVNIEIPSLEDLQKQAQAVGA